MAWIVLQTDRDGRSRRFAFIGFATAADAATAQSKLNATYIDTSKIVVEPAAPPKSAVLARPWSRHSEGSSAHKQTHPELYAPPSASTSSSSSSSASSASGGGAGKGGAAAAASGKIASLMQDPTFNAYASIVKPSKKDKKFWMNDDTFMLAEPGIASDKKKVCVCCVEGAFFFRSSCERCAHVLSDCMYVCMFAGVRIHRRIT